MAQWIVTKQIAVDAETPEEAVAKAATEGKSITVKADPRPQSAQVASSSQGRVMTDQFQNTTTRATPQVKGS